MKWIRSLLPLLALTVVLAAGCSKKSETAKVDETDEGLAARVGDWSISREFVEEYLRRM